MNRKILLMILFSFAAHMAVAALIVYLPSSMGTNETSGYQEKVIWGYVSGRGNIKGMRQSGIIADNILSKGRSNSSEKVNLTDAHIKYNQNDLDSTMSHRLTNDDENHPSPYSSPLRGEGQGEGVTMGFSDESSDNASDYASLPGVSSDSGDGICTTSSQCGSSEGQTDKTGSGSYDRHAIVEYVREEIERHKYYPHIAKLRGIEGTVYVNFYIGQNGIPGSITIARSSGSKILDQAGIQTILKIGKISNPYKELRELDIVVPITYKLE